MMKFATADDKQVAIEQFEANIAELKRRIIEQDFDTDKSVSNLLGLPATDRDVLESALSRLVQLGGGLREARMSTPDDHEKLGEMWP